MMIDISIDLERLFLNEQRSLQSSVYRILPFKNLSYLFSCTCSGKLGMVCNVTVIVLWILNLINKGT